MTSLADIGHVYRPDCYPLKKLVLLDLVDSSVLAVRPQWGPRAVGVANA